MKQNKIGTEYIVIYYIQEDMTQISQGLGKILNPV